MPHSFDPGPVQEPFRSLCEDYPEREVYPPGDFRVEWGPIFHRGRLDGSARVLVVGQDPAQHEAIARRILVGEAGQRVQAFLRKLGIDRSYVMINASLYSEWGRGSAGQHVDDPAIVAYRHRWLDALLVDTEVEAVVAFGSLARRAFERWRSSPAGQDRPLLFEPVRHPTFPEASSGGDPERLRAATKEMLEGWNAALGRLHAGIGHPDTPGPLVPYDVSTRPETAEIPEGDLPPGLPPWMRSVETWAERVGADAEERRATIAVTVPGGERPWSGTD
jgi:uracil-DNA glycosylase